MTSRTYSEPILVTDTVDIHAKCPRCGMCLSFYGTADPKLLASGERHFAVCDCGLWKLIAEVKIAAVRSGTTLCSAPGD